LSGGGECHGHDAHTGSDAAQAADDDDLIVRLYQEENPGWCGIFTETSVTREADELAQETFSFERREKC
jgi:hypothetical protein